MIETDSDEIIFKWFNLLQWYYDAFIASKKKEIHMYDILLHLKEILYFLWKRLYRNGFMNNLFTRNSPFFPNVDLLELKNKRIMRNCNTSKKIWTLLEINGVPDLSKIDLSKEANLLKFLKVVNNKNSNDFRAWFHNNKDLDEKEILKEYLGVLQQVPTIDKIPSKSLRFVSTSILGLIPVVGQLASFFDSFVINKLFKDKSPKFFIDDLTNFTGNLKL